MKVEYIVVDWLLIDLLFTSISYVQERCKLNKVNQGLKCFFL